MKIQNMLLALTPILMVVGCDKDDTASVDIDRDRTTVVRDSSVTNTERVIVATDARVGQSANEAAGASRETTINVQPPSVSRTENSVTVVAPTVEKKETIVVDEAGLTRVNELIRAESSASSVKVTSDNGKFVLKGSVRNEKDKADLAAKIGAVVGADKVDNQLEVKSE